MMLVKYFALEVLWKVRIYAGCTRVRPKGLKAGGCSLKVGFEIEGVCKYRLVQYDMTLDFPQATGPHDRMLNFDFLSTSSTQSLVCLFLFSALALVLPPLMTNHLPLLALLAWQLHPPLKISCSSTAHNIFQSKVVPVFL